MSIEQNKLIVTQFHEAMARNDGPCALTFLSDDATWWTPGDGPGGAIKTKAEMTQIFSVFSNLFRQPPRLDLLSLTAEGDRVALEKSGRDGVTPGGAQYGNDYFMLFRLRNGKIFEVREYYDPRNVEPLVAELQSRG